MVSVILLWLTFLPVIKGSLENEFCSAGPRKTMVATNAPHYYYFPYFVSIYQCGGSCDYLSPHIQHCAADTYQEIPLELVNPFTRVKKTLQLRNHTSCTCKCTADPSQCDPKLQEWKEKFCRCECKYKTSSPPTPCPQWFRWDPGECRCVCNRAPMVCEKDSEWSQEACACVCVTRVVKRCSRKNKFLDQRTCTCYDPPNPAAGKRIVGIERDVLIGLMLGELLLLVFLFDIFLCCKFNSGICFSVYRMCCGSCQSSPKREYEAPGQDLETFYWEKQTVV